MRQTDSRSDFVRREKKYLITEEKYALLMEEIRARLRRQSYSGETVCSVYYDTPDRLLIRLSLQHPVYKEKFRLRWYGAFPRDGIVYPEIKKKFRGIVYKRRIPCSTRGAEILTRTGSLPSGPDSAACREIAYLFRRYPLQPAVMIAYEREAYTCPESPELRITFDRNLRARERDLTPEAGDAGKSFMPSGTVLMEIKFPGSSPLWLAEALSRNRIFPTRFSKYGTWYLTAGKK